MTDQTPVPAFQPPSWEAKFQGRTLGYYATADEAQAAVDAAQADAEGRDVFDWFDPRNGFV